MGQGLSEEFKDDGVARIQFSKTLTNWFLESGFAKVAFVFILFSIYSDLI